jgi:hypothetical protein
MAINVAAIRDLLLPGLRGVTGEYKQWPSIWPKLFDQGKSEMAQERTASMRFLPLAQLKTDGGQTAFDNASGEAFVYNQLHTGIGLGYAITRNTISDNLYKAQFRPSNLGLQRSFAQTKEIYAANVFNTATTYQTSVGGDGVSLLNTAHPLPAGGSGPSTWSNTFSVAADLNETSLLTAMINIQTGFYDNAGLRMMATGKTLVIHPNNEPVALRLLRAELRPGTAMNDPNVIPAVAGGITDYVKDVFFTSNYAWFIKTDQPGLLYLEREPFEIDMQVDFTTDNLLVKAWERYSFNYNDPRSLFGTNPTS